MENKKQASSSSFTADLFGAKETVRPSSSTGIFASIFPPTSKVVGRNSTISDLTGSWLKQPPGNQVWSTKQGTPDNVVKNREGVSNSTPKKESSSMFQERVDTCPLSSSLYYGGQEDMYIHSSSTQSSGSDPTFKKDEGEDANGNNLQDASRGNWWQGSLYY
ncbi:hypothetical protein F0562_022010 [Nyssa sinensis]|uniref:Uncharacterized protein n=1 Tax=Nyssa sinensis TaxID=561372 RepID=A0A5J5BL51_9ASTE|nr:hypothetical protein F0562_022010 [Nyssa sinensis]